MAATPRPTRRKPETLRARRITAGLTVNDLARSVRFYTEGLGFVVDERWEEGDRLMGVGLKVGKARLVLSQDDYAKGHDRVKGVGMRLWVNTIQDLKELAARVRAAGITIDQEPQPLPWGPMAFAVTDPDGFQLTIAHEA